jgi:hypothetical protein
LIGTVTIDPDRVGTFDHRDVPGRRSTRKSIGDASTDAGYASCGGRPLPPSPAAASQSSAGQVVSMIRAPFRSVIFAQASA